MSNLVNSDCVYFGYFVSFDIIIQTKAKPVSAKQSQRLVKHLLQPACTIPTSQQACTIVPLNSLRLKKEPSSRISSGNHSKCLRMDRASSLSSSSGSVPVLL